MVDEAVASQDVDRAADTERLAERAKAIEAQKALDFAIAKEKAAVTMFQQAEAA